MITPSSIISTAVAAMTTVPDYRRGIPADFNIELDGLTADTVILELPYFTEGEPTKDGWFQNRYTVRMQVLQASELSDDYDTTRATRQDTINAIASELIARIHIAAKSALPGRAQLVMYETHSANPLNEDDFNGFFNLYDSNLDGVGLTIVLDIKQSSPVCFV